MKIQFLLAQSATIFNLIFKFFSIFISPIYERKMKELVMIKIFEINNEDFQENKEKESTLKNIIIDEELKNDRDLKKFAKIEISESPKKERNRRKKFI